MRFVRENTIDLALRVFMRIILRQIVGCRFSVEFALILLIMA
jgi:hypothetical protein